MPPELQRSSGPSRGRAALWHLVVSASVVGSVLAVMLELWYPRPLFQAAGGANLIAILASVDVALGPLVTLIIFDSARKSARELTLDLATIALLQLAALGYGVHTLFQARPVFIVFAVDRFDVVSPVDIPPGELAKARGEFGSLPLTGPRLVAAEMPSDPRERNRILLSALSGGLDLQSFPQYYKPYPGAAAQVLARAGPVSALIARHPEARSELERQARALGRPVAQLRYLPVRARLRTFAALIDPSNAAVLGYAMVDPW